MLDFLKLARDRVQYNKVGYPYYKNNGFLELKATPDYNLSKLYPELAQQWHTTKNKELTPVDVTPGSSRKLWWQCGRGHEWEAIVANRAKGTGCPYCAGQKPTKENNLALKYPALVKEWHSTKNMDLTPYKVTPRSNKKVWWICSQGHEWEARVYSRVTSGGVCPYCAGIYPTKENNLGVKYPILVKEWHPTKNGKLTPYDVTPGSGLKVWWRCNQGQDHEWQTSVVHRKNGRGCPYCAGKKASEDYNLATVYPEIAKLWHPTKNGNLEPKAVTPGSTKKVWWRCERGHSWLASMNHLTRGRGASHRTRGRGCPYCSGKKVSADNNLAINNPVLASQWHLTKNDLTPYDVTPGSSRKVWWHCNQGQDHEWKTSICDRSRGTGCPFCSGKKVGKDNNLGALFPEIAKQWHPIKNGNLTPFDVTSSSNKKVWWTCDLVMSGKQRLRIEKTEQTAQNVAGERVTSQLRE